MDGVVQCARGVDLFVDRLGGAHPRILHGRADDGITLFRVPVIASGSAHLRSDDRTRVRACERRAPRREPHDHLASRSVC